MPAEGLLICLASYQHPPRQRGCFLLKTDSEKRLWIFVNGEVPDLQLLRLLLQPGDVFFAADGGYRFLEQLGLVPQRVIGDLDSLSAAQVNLLEKQGIIIERYPVEKDETDLELALKRGVAEGFEVIRVAGALGGRFDQSLGNLFLLMKKEFSALDVRLEDGMDEVFLIHSEVQILGSPGDTVSLLPLGGDAIGITTHGLKYALKDETLYSDRSRGISNVMLTGQARVTLEGGTLICVHRRII
jgi:thiamine pyrophosphokinase